MDIVLTSPTFVQRYFLIPPLWEVMKSRVCLLMPSDYSLQEFAYVCVQAPILFLPRAAPLIINYLGLRNCAVMFINIGFI